MTLTEAQAYCRTVTQQSRSNFYYSFLFLPRDRREAMYAIYAFCREVDSVVDDPLPGTDAREQLNTWRRELAAAYQGSATHPVTISLASHVQRLQIPQDLFQELIAGVEMDLTRCRYDTFEELSLYCYRVASVVGLICLYVFGTRSQLARDYAINLGIAFQLTNILRDVASDAERGRVYLPQADLRQFGYAEEDLLAQIYSPEFIALMRFQVARALSFYAQASQCWDQLSPAEHRALTVAEIMRGVYERILRRVESSEFRIFGRRITLAPAYRLAIAASVWIRSRLS
jgi:15-cis-phytoene synthase